MTCLEGRAAVTVPQERLVLVREGVILPRRLVQPPDVLLEEVVGDLRDVRLLGDGARYRQSGNIHLICI